MDRIRHFVVWGMAVSWGCAITCRTGKVGRNGFLLTCTDGGGYDLLQRGDANSLLQLDDFGRGDTGLVWMVAMRPVPQRTARNRVRLGGSDGGQMDSYPIFGCSSFGSFGS
jgi:hypothetical protein